ncbi:2-phosphoglycolate phosphatase [Nadsonia fulvescens var. elongata DSM 6958]|uniref:4-nitrophenylphosphatase n=1 Tax=Nadsonia fulvescens var. elongata DSM 6958 TaxID=857566 RepID=A0A1E3PHS8_9ASCO|nr:2-phosphoglycolate phosphatase [Nadsonia fulvescens var. elongata DSM 6958]
MSTKITNKEQVEAFLESYDTFLFDCDGVLWSGTHLLPHVVETIELLRSRGKRLIFVTNNSTKSRKAYTGKFAKFGITVSENEIFGSAYSSAVYLSKVLNFPKDKKVLVVGEKGIEEELESVGINYIGGTDPAYNVEATDASLASLARDESIGAVLCGLDLHLNYYKISKALLQIQDPNCHFLATNIDSTFPSAGRLLPGAGTIVGTLITSSGRTPVALGKPSDEMMNCVKEAYHLDPSKTCMVGDRLNTDMKFGEKGGLGTFMVLTGVDKEETILGTNPLVTPKFYADRLGLLYELLQNN